MTTLIRSSIACAVIVLLAAAASAQQGGGKKIVPTTPGVKVLKRPNVLIVLPGTTPPRAFPASQDLCIEDVGRMWEMFARAGFALHLATIDGGEAPVVRNAGDTTGAEVKKFLNAGGIRALTATRRLRDLDVTSYRAVVFAGGPAALTEFPDAPVIYNTVRSVLDAGNIIGCAGYGAAALLFAQKNDTTALLPRLRVTCPSESEEEEYGIARIVPSRLETTLRRMGAIYFKDHPGQVNVVTDDRVLTAQNRRSIPQLAYDILIRMQQLDAARPKPPLSAPAQPVPRATPR